MRYLFHDLPEGAVPLEAWDIRSVIGITIGIVAIFYVAHILRKDIK